MNLDDRLFFVIGSPRSGTTMLMRMLNVHDEIYTRPEPHLLTPLAHLGYFAYVDKAPYDQFQAAEASKAFVSDLPGGEQDYVDAVRAYADTLYGRMLEPTGKKYFLDKTPAYALILPFLARIYPKAKYVVLTRHPFAIFSSYAKSFFDNDWAGAHAFNPVVERYVPAIAAFLRSAPVPNLYHVRYEALVQDPEGEMQALCKAIDLPYQASMIEYGNKGVEGEGLGDPIGVKADTRPNTRSVESWALEVKDNDERLELLQQMVQQLGDEDLAVWGFTRENLWDPLKDVDPGKAQKVQSAAKKWDRYHMQRRMLLHLRRGIHGSSLGSTLDRVRFYCDVLLRE